jgi:arsenite methyltransferase
MSLNSSDASETALPPAWLADVLGAALPDEGATVELQGRPFVLSGGVLRARELVSAAQAQTSEAFGFKWQRRDTFESPVSRSRMREWLHERYGNVTQERWWAEHGDSPLVVDAGCGAAFSAVELLGDALHAIRYLGADISDAVDVAARRFRELGLPGAFVQADLLQLPLAPGSVDVLLSEGVLHHTDSTRDALLALAALLRPGGRFLLYVYRRKGPIREFTDDLIRERLQELTPEEAWEALLPLTKLGRALGELDVEVDVPEDVELLGIPAGRISVQRLFYWHVFKAFHHPEMTLDELHHINYDWYAPRNAHRQSLEEVRSWCAEAGLDVERERAEPAGITIIARKR